MRSANNNNFDRVISRSRSNNPYSNLLSENPNNINGVPPSFLKILGPLAPLLLSDDHHDPDELQRRLRLYALSLLGTSVFFWLWAVYNTVQLRRSSGFDLGVVSFLGSGLSASLLWRASLGGRCCQQTTPDDEAQDVYGARKEHSRGASPGHAPPGKSLRAFSVLTHLMVVANYLLGLLFAFTAGSRVYVYFATYCCVFALLWTVVALSGWVLVSAYREAVGRAYGEDAINPPSRTCLGICLGAWMTLTNQSIGYGTGVNNNEHHYGNDEEEEIDDELRSLYEGHDGYTNT